MVELPARFTVEWLGAALVEAAEANAWGALTGVDTEPIGTGQMGENLRLRLTWDGNGPSSLVAKLPALDPTSRATGAERGSYEREVRFYQEVAPTVSVRTPACYYAASAGGGSEFVLIMEDVAPAIQGDQLAGASIEQAADVMAEAVALHAPRWGDPTLTNYDFLDPPNPESTAMIAAVYRHFLDEFVDRHSGVMDPTLLEVVVRFGPHFERWSSMTSPPYTLVHGDFRLDNMMFRPGHRPVVVDWQTFSLGSGLRDVAYYLSAGLSVDDRRSAEHDLVNRYHQGLVAAGVDHLDWDTAWKQYRANSFAGLVMAVIATGLVVQTERGDQMFRVMAQGSAQMVLDLGAESLLP